MNNQELLDLLLKAVDIVRTEMGQQYVEPVNLSDLMNEWPEAIPLDSICPDTEEEKTIRGANILTHIDDLEDKKFLDFGCGEGHVTLAAVDLAVKPVGYDIISTGNLKWESDEKYLLTTDFSKVMPHAPYDRIILHDVLDHCVDPIAALNQVKSVCSSKTKIIVRCHSWMSRHGAHLYKQLNKAWIQLFFTEEQLLKMGIKIDFVQKYHFPLNVHKDWFYKSGFDIKSSDIVRATVEDFFKNPQLLAALPKEFKGQLPVWQMTQSFNDYILQIK